ncbi:MAG: MFS transporter [Gammaproteobacteria bacterium]|nr:MFS transporter [Gammaproteobacteria bacterium]MYC53668.1 MFS transporter [Gammaproteobacteria bacterium]
MGMSLWFTASALSPELTAQWGLSEAQAGWLTTVVQLGFVAGTAVAAFLNLADIFPARRYFCVSALLGAAVNALVLVAPGYGSALALRFFTGFFLAGVYPPAMKMIATWFRDARGFAIGTIVGALTVGKAVPYLLTSVEGGGAALVLAGASLACAASGLLVLTTYRDGPYRFERRPFSWRLAGTVVWHRETRLAIAGYLGHMWELYPMWATIALFFGDYFAGGGGLAAAGGGLPGVADGGLTGTVAGTVSAAALAGVAGFGAIAIGGVGAVLAGTWADRLGRERVTIWSMAVSGACAAVMGWLLAAPFWLVAVVAGVWGFAVVADSAQFSAVVTEVAPRHAVGTALTLQTSLGFLLTAATIWMTVELETRFGWRVAFGVLALGPWAGIVAMRRLQRLRAGST